jgi:AmmeMemoRadiSam system protein B
MDQTDHPRLRPLHPQKAWHDERPHVRFLDPAGYVSPDLLVPIDFYNHVLRHCDGQTSPREIQARALRSSGQLITADRLTQILDQLEQAMVLDGPTYRAAADEYAQQQTRPAAFAGRSYPASERALTARLASYFTAGAGTPEPPETQTLATDTRSTLRAILSPHIDFERGGPVYSWAYRELAERSDAEVFVILGVAHQPCARRFVLTYKDFATPLGTTLTDRAYVRAIADASDRAYFDDEAVHRLEHSIEFQAVFLRHALGERADQVRIVPILVGSFHDLMTRGIDPITEPEVARFVTALRTAEHSSRRKVAYIGGIDLSHVGPEFGDPVPTDAQFLDEVRAQDSAILAHAAQGDARGWFARTAAVSDRFRVCGLAATYTLLHAAGPVSGSLLRYEQACDPAGQACVSFASVALDSSR